MRYTVWYGESKSGAEYVAEMAGLDSPKPEMRPIWANREFARNPAALQHILYLDKPDVIVTQGDPEKPILAVEFCTEGPTGHDLCQRFPRVAAAAELGIPFAYVFPRRKWISRQTGNLTKGRWDTYNPLPLRAMWQMGRFHGAPVLAFFWDADRDRGRTEDGCLLYDPKYSNLPDRREPEMQDLAMFLTLTVQAAADRRPTAELALDPVCLDREAKMQEAYWTRAGRRRWSPLSQTKEVRTLPGLAQYVKRHAKLEAEVPEHLRGRERTLIYAPKVNTFRADPYAGGLVALDYHECRSGPTPSHRHKNLVLHLPKVSIEAAAAKFERYHQHECPFRRGSYTCVDPYLTLHLRDGCRYTKQKELRVFCYLADMVIFKDAVLL